GLLPVADLRVVVGVAAGEQEGVVVGELFQGAADVLDGGPFAGDAEGDVPQAGQVAGFSAVEAVPGRDAGEGAFLAGRPGAGTTAGRRRPRAYSSHDGLLRARTGPRVGRMCPWDKVEQAAGARGAVLRNVHHRGRMFRPITDAEPPDRPCVRLPVRTRARGPGRARGWSGRSAGGSPWRRSCRARARPPGRCRPAAPPGPRR